jgi:hypothetical protein
MGDDFFNKLHHEKVFLLTLHEPLKERGERGAYL